MPTALPPHEYFFPVEGKHQLNFEVRWNKEKIRLLLLFLPSRLTVCQFKSKLYFNWSLETIKKLKHIFF